MIMKKKEKIFLDITKDKCPITFVKTKIALEKLKSNQYLNVYIKDGEALDGLPSSLKELGYQIKNKVKINDDVFSLEISKEN
jgi:tRNA 2-thiouridine synthesizing protein A